jgi:ribonuclease BN (tRNA processing enzyme)
MKIEKFDSKLKLTNNGGLSFFFIGVGGAFAQKNNQTNLLVIKGKTHILIDCGTTCNAAFLSYKSCIKDVKNLLITHSHADHIGSLESVALKGRYIAHKKPNIIITKEYKKILWEESLRGGLMYGEATSEGFLNFDDYFTVIEPQLVSEKVRPLYHCKVGKIDLKIFRTNHIPGKAGTWKSSFYSVGVLVDERILFPSDTRFDPELLKWMVQEYPTIEYIFHDCQFFTGGVHASYDELKTLPGAIKAKMFLSHYSDEYKLYAPKADGFLGFAKQGVYYCFDEK